MKRYDYSDAEKRICFLYPHVPMTFEERDEIQTKIDWEKLNNDTL